MAFLNPGILDTLDGLNKSVIFMKINLKQGYYQVAMEAKDISKTGFVILHEHYEYLRLPQGDISENNHSYFRRLTLCKNLSGRLTDPFRITRRTCQTCCRSEELWNPQMLPFVNKEVFNNVNMVENQVLNKKDLQIKFFRAEISYEDDQKKSSLIERLQDEVVECIINENKQKVTWDELKNVLEKKFEDKQILKKEEEIKEKDEAKVIKALEKEFQEKWKLKQIEAHIMMRRLIMFNRQTYGESLETYARSVFEIARKTLLFEDIKAIIAATSMKRFDKYMTWETEIKEEQMLYFIKIADRKMEEERKIRERMEK
ncbi:putative LRT retrotransposon [Pseudoloma neurophilia]|uniref:Putative LRT retrotransposon n=1 Tax=Pseudoloma neurophilia TaxID=146866 RepID=A0A0R0M356_9MICR|nr:putative LRT retrotransposon [Pseudoloma neurophilia]